MPYLQHSKMESLHIIYSFIFLILILFNDVSPLTLNAVKSADKAIFGDSTTFTLSCTYIMEPQDTILYYMQLKRKRDTESTFETIVNFQSPTDNLNVTYVDTDLESRTVATKPTVESKTATLMFNRIACDDKATYQWIVFYSKAGLPVEVNKTLSFTVKAVTSFEDDNNGRVTYSPSSNLEEGDIVTFTCSGDVGNDPVGHLGWYHYLNNDTNVPKNISSQAIPTAPVYNPTTCSYTRASRLMLTMEREFNEILVRCTVQQDTFSQFGNGYKQTKNIEVFYSPMVTSIEDQTVDEGRESVTLNCNADAHPPPTYYWLLPNGTMSDGKSLTLRTLQIGDNGTYTCVVYNLFKGANHTMNETTYLDVRKTTTPPPTTTTTPSPGSTDGGKVTNKPAPVKGGDDDNTTTIIIAVVVPVVLIAILVVVIILCLKKRRRPKEIEEPPEKPRNNQDLSFYGNRPDLVSADHGMKNNSALNSSFNNSFESSSDVKPRNEDGLLYVDLQFDDKPRSRRPIQIVDNGSTPYADIVNPRV